MRRYLENDLPGETTKSSKIECCLALNVASKRYFSKIPAFTLRSFVMLVCKLQIRIKAKSLAT